MMINRMLSILLHPDGTPCNTVDGLQSDRQRRLHTPTFFMIPTNLEAFELGMAQERERAGTIESGVHSTACIDQSV